MEKSRRFLTFASFLTILAFGCGLAGREEVRLGVPYVQQPSEALYCGPTTVLMWRKYDGLPEVTLQEIADWMNASSSTGVSPAEIADAVNHYTASNDAYWDLVGEDELRNYMSRQITSIDSLTPVIAIVEQGFHAVVVDGGKYHSQGDGFYQWDYIFFHDPQLAAGIRYSASEWLNHTCFPGTPCSQVVSVFASKAWNYNLDLYGDSIIVAGGGGNPRLNQDF